MHTRSAFVEGMTSPSKLGTEAAAADHCRVTERARRRSARVEASRSPIDRYPAIRWTPERATALGVEPGSEIQWRRLDEDISLEGLLPSGESPASLERWRQPAEARWQTNGVALSIVKACRLIEALAT